MQEGEAERSMSDSFIQNERVPCCLRILAKFDFFAFIPVPKDDQVSTKKSIAGSILFLVIFFAFFIFDFVTFIVDNPPLQQNYFSSLQGQTFKLPRVAIAYMEGQALNETDTYDQYFNFSLTQEVKDKGYKNATPKEMTIFNFNQSNDDPNKLLDWLDDDTKEFYRVLRTPKEPTYAKGLLYSTSNSSYSKILVSICDSNSTEDCKQQSNITRKAAEGRLFLFIENPRDTTSISREDPNDPTSLIYNFFLIPNLYKRVTFKLQVVKTQIFPDYFLRWTTQYDTRLQVLSINEQISNTSIFALEQQQQPLQMLSVSFQLDSQVLNSRVNFKTILDHFALWGAFWGAEFGIFAVVFLTYNRRKFYKKNPDWDQFRKVAMQQTLNTNQSKLK